MAMTLLGVQTMPSKRLDNERTPELNHSSSQKIVMEITPREYDPKDHLDKLFKGGFKTKGCSDGVNDKTECCELVKNNRVCPICRDNTTGVHDPIDYPNSAMTIYSIGKGKEITKRRINTVYQRDIQRATLMVKRGMSIVTNLSLPGTLQDIRICLLRKGDRLSGSTVATLDMNIHCIGYEENGEWVFEVVPNKDTNIINAVLSEDGYDEDGYMRKSRCLRTATPYIYYQRLDLPICTRLNLLSPMAR